MSSKTYIILYYKKNNEFFFTGYGNKTKVGFDLLNSGWNRTQIYINKKFKIVLKLNLL